MSQILQPAPVSPSVVPKKMWPVVRQPWIARCLVDLGLERQFYTRLDPGRHGGRTGRIRHVSPRITDRGNLRCHTCGQRGDSGYLHEAGPATLRRAEGLLSACSRRCGLMGY